MKNANGAGSVSKMTDGRRKPWKAVVTKSMEYDPERGEVVQRRAVVGYYRTRREAEDALSTYRQNPYDLDARRISFAEVYERWKAVHYEKISPSLARAYKAAYKHAAPLHNLRFASIRPAHIEQCMAEADTGSATKNGIKQLCNLLYKYAIKSELATVNYAAMCDGVRQDDPVIIRRPFTGAEEALLWNNLGLPAADMILIGMYSGWRPKELTLIESSAVDLTERTFTGGIKTAAGRSRVVPIHHKILPLVTRRMEVGAARLFVNEKGKPYTYNTYNQSFKKIMQHFGLDHTPHDTRHTFVTKAKEAGLDDYVLKLIVGHAIADLTEKVYTHRQLDELRREIEKIP